MERQFHTQFFKVELEICIAKLSRVTQIIGRVIHYSFQKSEEYMQNPSPKNRVRKDGPKGT